MLIKKILFIGITLIGLIFFLIMSLIAIYFILHRTNPKMARLFKSELEGVNRIRVTTTHPQEDERKTLFEKSNKDEVAELIRNIKFARLGLHGRCACYGDVLFEFYKDENIVATVSFHHKKRLRWKKWPHDMELTRKSALYLFKWIEDNTPKELFKEVYAYIIEK